MALPPLQGPQQRRLEALPREPQAASDRYGRGGRAADQQESEAEAEAARPRGEGAPDEGVLSDQRAARWGRRS